MAHKNEYLQAGDLVRLKSGGPVMVLAFDPYLSGGVVYARVYYHTKDGTIRQHVVTRAALTPHKRKSVKKKVRK